MTNVPLAYTIKAPTTGKLDMAVQQVLNGNRTGFYKHIGAETRVRQKIIQPSQECTFRLCLDRRSRSIITMPLLQ